MTIKNQILDKNGYNVVLNKSEILANSKKLKLNVDQYPKCQRHPQIVAYAKRKVAKEAKEKFLNIFKLSYISNQVKCFE